MPYVNNSELPDSIKSVLPSSAQTIFRKVVNSVLEKGGNEESAYKQAWSVIKKAGYKKGENGKWTRLKESAFREAIWPNSANAHLRSYAKSDVTPCDECLFFEPPHDPEVADTQAWCIALACHVEPTDTCDVVHPVIDSDIEVDGIFLSPGMGKMIKVKVNGKYQSIVMEDMMVNAYRGHHVNENGKFAYYRLSDSYTLEQLLNDVGDKFVQSFTMPVAHITDNVRLEVGELIAEVKIG